MLTKPLAAKSRSTCAVSHEVSSYSPKAFGRPAFGTRKRTHRRCGRAPRCRAAAAFRRARSSIPPPRVSHAGSNSRRPRWSVRQRAARGVGDGPRDDDRKVHPHLVERLAHGEKRGFGVQGVEDGLDENGIDTPAIRRAPRRRRPAPARRSRRCDTRIVHVGRKRRRAAGGAECARDEALVSGERVTWSAASRASRAAARFSSVQTRTGGSRPGRSRWR